MCLLSTKTCATDEPDCSRATLTPPLTGNRHTKHTQRQRGKRPLPLAPHTRDDECPRVCIQPVKCPRLHSHSLVLPSDTHIQTHSFITVRIDRRNTQASLVPGRLTTPFN
uniref:Uncharacterized protein n=1 Tax=Vitrella brassicaformis TaxID=1169539 RepID=A0A7S1JJD2_9ALVE